MASNHAAANKDEYQISGDGNKTPAATRSQHHPPPPMKCPRCDSPNTKFCYYNNYTQSQPRYFCKACRRYWTKGGALRSVPVGGSCRRIKKMTKSARFSDIGIPREFTLDGIKIPSFNSSAAALIRRLSAIPPANPCFSLDQSPFFYSNFQEMANLAPSPIDQDFPWNLQRQMIQETQLILFQDMEISMPPPQATFGNSSRNTQDFTTSPSPVNPPVTNTFGNGNGNGNRNGDDDWEDLIQAWTNSIEYTIAP